MSRMITKISDGLGNQLFQYAVGFAAARRLGLPLDLDVTWYRRTPRSATPRHLDLPKIVPRRRYRNLLYYGLPARALNRLTETARGASPGSYQFGLPVEQFRAQNADAFREISGASYITGYPFNFRLFEDSLGEIRADLNNSLIGHIPSSVSAGEYCFLHVRRDDIVAKSTFRDRLGILEAGYFQRAMEFYEVSFGKTSWLLCSDDPLAAMELMPKTMDVVLSPGQSALEDLAIMAHADGGVISNSTFSFWGGLLCAVDEPRIIAPKKWRQDGRPGIPLPDRWHAV